MLSLANCFLAKDVSFPLSNQEQEQYEIIKTKRNEIKEERQLTEDDMAKITTEMLIESGTLDMDKTEQQLFFELFKYMLKRTSGKTQHK